MAAISLAVRVVVDGNIPIATTSTTTDSEDRVAIGTRSISIAQTVENVSRESEIRMAIKRSAHRLPLVRRVPSPQPPRFASVCPMLPNSPKARHRQADLNHNPHPEPMVGLRPGLHPRRRRPQSSQKPHGCLRRRKLLSSQNRPNL